MNLGGFREPQRKGARAGEKIQNLSRLADMANHKFSHGILGRRHRLQKTAGRRRDGGAAEIDQRLFGLDDDLAVHRQPRDAGPHDEIGERAAVGRRQRPAVARGDVEAGFGARHRQVEGLARARDPRRDVADERQLRLDLGNEDRAFLDVDNLVREGAVVAEHRAALGAAGGEDGAASRGRRAGHDVGDGRVDAARFQRIDHLAALPGEVGIVLHMLERAAAADGEVPAGRRDALRRRFQHGDQFRPLLLARRRHLLAGQGKGDEDRPALGMRDAVALRAEALDAEA